MKKVISVFVLAIMAVSMLFAVAGCSDNSALLAEIEELKDRVEDLENKNNVFWTDKAEYAEDETMTVYFRNTAVYKIRLDFNTLPGTAFWITGNDVINYHLIITSLVVDQYAGFIIDTSYVTWGDGNFLPNISSSNMTICHRGIETEAGGSLHSDENATNKQRYDFVICVPGTAFELARFVNVSVDY